MHLWFCYRFRKKKKEEEKNIVSASGSRNGIKRRQKRNEGKKNFCRKVYALNNFSLLTLCIYFLKLFSTSIESAKTFVCGEILSTSFVSTRF